RQALQAPAHPGGRAAPWNLALAKRRGRIDAGHVDHTYIGAIFMLERLLPSTCFRGIAGEHDRRRRREKALERYEQRRLRASRLGKPCGKELDGAFGRVDVARLGCKMAERDQRLRRDAVTGRRRVVVHGLRAVVKALVIVAREPESAALAILETVEQRLGERKRKRPVL